MGICRFVDDYYISVRFNLRHLRDLDWQIARGQYRHAWTICQTGHQWRQLSWRHHLMSIFNKIIKLLILKFNEHACHAMTDCIYQKYFCLSNTHYKMKYIVGYVYYLSQYRFVLALGTSWLCFKGTECFYKYKKIRGGIINYCTHFKSRG